MDVSEGVDVGEVVKGGAEEMVGETGGGMQDYSFTMVTNKHFQFHLM